MVKPLRSQSFNFVIFYFDFFPFSQTESDYEHSSANNQSATIRRIVIFIIFFCSIVSLLLLLVTLLIFCYFK